ncbi:MAG TPA: hypothetical protein VF757_11735 [Sphingomicrobium sp.]
MFKTIFAFVMGLACASAAAAAPAPVWQASETEHFTIYSASPPDRVLKLATDLESYDKLMRMATGISPDEKPVKVRIYQVDDIRDVQKALGLEDTGIAGFYSSNSLGPFLVTPRKTGFESEDFGPDLVLHHEYAHHFMLQYFPASYPGWYTEGFAELVGSSKIMPDGRIGYGMPAKHRGHEIAAYWVPLQELLTKEKVTYLDTYGQGWALTHYLTFDSKRAAEFRRYLAALNAGRPLDEAAKAFGDLGALDHDARSYVLNGVFDYRPVKVDISQPVIRSVRPLSAGEAALIPEVIAYSDEDLNAIEKTGWRERALKLREANLSHAREKVALYPSDPFALYFLAEAEYGLGHYAESEAAADRLLAINPNHVRGLARKAIDMAERAQSLPQADRLAKAQEARHLAARANQLDKEDPLPLLAYYESFHAAGEKPPAVAVEGLMQVVSTLPRDTRARGLLVDELASQHRYAEAIGWLSPLVNNLDASPLRDSVRKKMDWLKAQLATQQGTSQAAR